MGSMVILHLYVSDGSYGSILGECHFILGECQGLNLEGGGGRAVGRADWGGVWNQPG